MFNYLQPDPRQLSSAKKKGFSLQLWAKNKKMKEKKKKTLTTRESNALLAFGQ